MLTTAQNQLITQTGPGTPCGALMRRYWQPAALAEELDTPRPVKRVRLLGEDLVLFRDDDGRYGLLHRHCAHRGADLAFARCEDGGLRCPFHGWLYDATGACLEQPAEPAGSTFHLKVRQPAYRCVERSGIVWAYMGPGEPPPFPSFDCFVAPGTHTFRLQGPVVVQLAAGAGGRHRSRACQSPAPLLRGRRPVRRRLRPPVPRRDHRRRHPDDPADARSAQSPPGIRGNPVRPAHHHAAPDQRPRSPICASPTWSSRTPSSFR